MNAVSSQRGCRIHGCGPDCIGYVEREDKAADELAAKYHALRLARGLNPDRSLGWFFRQLYVINRRSSGRLLALRKAWATTSTLWKARRP